MQKYVLWRTGDQIIPPGPFGFFSGHQGRKLLGGAASTEFGIMASFATAVGLSGRQLLDLRNARRREIDWHDESTHLILVFTPSGVPAVFLFDGLNYALVALLSAVLGPLAPETYVPGQNKVFHVVASGPNLARWASVYEEIHAANPEHIWQDDLEGEPADKEQERLVAWWREHWGPPLLERR